MTKAVWVDALSRGVAVGWPPGAVPLLEWMVPPKTNGPNVRKMSI